MEYPSRLLEKAINEFAKLPGLGRRSALRLALHMLKRDAADVEAFAAAILDMRLHVKRCAICHNISDVEICPICADKNRDRATICVVENIRDVMAIENTGQYGGLYHVLGGIISPMEGVGPKDIEIESLVKRVQEGGINEVILALSPTMEGDTTNFYISRQLSPYEVTVSVIARGVAIGDELEYADEVTLGRSILNRTPFK